MGYQKEDETYVDPSHNSMRIVPIAVLRVWIDVCVSEHVELLKTSATSRIYREQYRPGEEASNKGDYDCHLEISQ